MSERYLQWVIPGEQPDYGPVEPVGTLTVRSNGTSHIDNLLDVLPGKYALIPLGADDEPAPHGWDVADRGALQ